MISTIIIIALVVLLAVIGAHRGAARTLLNLAATAANIMITGFLSRLVANAVYSNLIRPTVLTNLENTIKSSGEQFTAQNSIKALPEGAQNLLSAFTGLFGVKPEQLQGRLAPSANQTAQIAQSIEKPVGDLMTAVLSILFTIVIFIILMIVFKLIIRSVSGVFRLPVISQINRILGFVLGTVEGIVLVCIAANILYLSLSYALPAALENTQIFGKLFYFLVVLD